MPKITPIISLMLVVVLLAITAAPVISADSTQVYFDSVNINIESANASIYDEIVNLADPTLTNVDTWLPAPEGVFIGGQTQESRFNYGVNHTIFDIKTKVNFSSSQIMDGASFVVIRSPWAATATTDRQILIIQDSNNNRVFSLAATPGTSLSDSYYESNGRSYFLVRAIINPGEVYSIQFRLILNAVSNPDFYVSPNDVASDNMTNMSISAAGGVIDYFDADPGISYDFRKGSGGGVVGISIPLNTGETYAFTVSKSDFSGNSRLQLMFPTNSGEDWRVDVKINALIEPSYNSVVTRISATNVSTAGGIYLGSAYGTFGASFNNIHDEYYHVFITALQPMEFNFTAYGMSSWSGASSYVLPAGRVLDDILFAGNIELSNYIGYNNIYSLSLFPVVTLTPTANTWAGPGPMDTWAVPEAPVMDPTSLLEQLSFAVLDAVLLPVNWVFVATTGTSLSQVVYDAYLAGAVDAANNFIQNGVDRVIDIAREVVTMIYGIGEEILTVLTIALSVIADAIGALAGLIALLVIQGIFFWVLTSIIRLGESIISSARGDSERARKILDKEGVA